MFGRVAQTLDQLGMRPLLAKAASLAYPGQSFSVDSSGRWVNREARATIVSPIIHVAPYSAYRQWVLDHWTWAYTPQPHDIILDLGTGIGEEAVIFSELASEGKIYAVEAHPDTFACLTDTVRLSGLDNVVPIHCAIGAEDGSIRLGSGPSHISNSVLSEGGHAVPMRTVDSLVAEYEIERIDFFRTNIEGAERLMLPGMTKAARLIRNLCISCHDFVADAGGDESFRSRTAVVEWLDDHGFERLDRPPQPPPARDFIYARRRS